MVDTFDKLLWELERCRMSTTRRQFTDEFKGEAVGLLSSSGRPLSQIARELGIAASMLRAWRDAGGRGDTGPPRRSNTQAAAPYSGTDRPIQHGQDALIRLGRVFRFRSAIAGLIKAGQSIGGVAHSPFRRSAGRAANLSANRTAGHALGRPQHDPRPLAQPVFGLGGTRQRFQLCSFRFRQYDRARSRNAIHASLNHDSPFRTAFRVSGPTKEPNMSTQVVLITGGLTGIGRA